MFVKEKTLAEALKVSRISYDKIRGEVNAIEAEREDFTVNNIGSSITIDDQKILCIPGGKQIEMKDWAFSQLCARIGVPASYMDKCYENGFGELAAQNINEWIGAKGSKRVRGSENWMIRTYKGKADAILTDKYQKFDSNQILDVFEDCIDVPSYSLKGSYVSDERLHLRFVDMRRLKIRGEDLYPAIFVDSSDVGRRTLSVQLGVWKKVCTNGLCIPKEQFQLFSQSHKVNGLNPKEFEQTLRASVKAIPEIQSQMIDMIKKCMQNDVNIKDADIAAKCVNLLKRLTGVDEENAHEILDLASEKYSLTEWGVVNAITEYAQRVELDDRIRLEYAAGKIMANSML